MEFLTNCYREDRAELFTFYLFKNVLYCFILLFIYFLNLFFIFVGDGRVELRSSVSILDMLSLRYLLDI